MRTTYCGLVSEALMGQTVTLMGWAHRRRDHGGVIFIDLRDREGLVQVVFDPDRADSFKIAEDVRNEFCLKVTGVVRARPAGTENAGLTSGKIEVLGHTLEVLNASVTPPFQLDDENLSETTRLTHRVLDLANLVAELTGATVEMVPDPRKEALENDLVVRNDQFLALGLNPITLSEGLLREINETAGRYADRADYSRIPATSLWTKNQQAGIPSSVTGSN